MEPLSSLFRLIVWFFETILNLLKAFIDAVINLMHGFLRVLGL